MRQAVTLCMTQVSLFYSGKFFVRKHTCTHESTWMFHDCYVSAGNAVLAEWLKENMQLSDALSRAVRCAFKIRDVCMNQRSTYDSIKSIKIGPYLVLCA